MIEIAPKSKDSKIGEEHLYIIMFGLQDALEFYKSKSKTYNKIDYNRMTVEEIHLMKWYQNKVFDTEKILKEINKAIENIKD